MELTSLQNLTDFVLCSVKTGACMGTTSITTIILFAIFYGLPLPKKPAAIKIKCTNMHTFVFIVIHAAIILNFCNQ